MAPQQMVKNKGGGFDTQTQPSRHWGKGDPLAKEEKTISDWEEGPTNAARDVKETEGKGLSISHGDWFPRSQVLLPSGRRGLKPPNQEKIIQQLKNPEERGVGESGITAGKDLSGKQKLRTLFPGNR